MNRTTRFKLQHTLPARQRGMVLLVSLVFLLLLTLLGISSMQNATLQEKMAGSVQIRNLSFQAAEAVLRRGESSIKVVGYTLAKCTNCLPPAESTTLTAAGVGASGVSWLAAPGGFYGVQNLGTTATPISRPPTCTGTVTLYRVTSVAIQGTSRTVLESIYANC
ncbi:pilus assembly PilX family protein [Pseudomonas syringae]|uniref:Type IV pilus assembly protein PilX n=3 Tax=Pseudomonas syringae TaxID=317 RepID=A0A656JRI9_PSESF|nr:PilX N-terminal domain-containing pilus assembly protein [Pseudomonas syringae]EPN48414.1 type IV pilus assembly protein PilX [Pseudomonas syringae pv. actinidiae ICMP 19096]EPM49228.1 type IV pilus assembly protein PilX [Pseudomonas syringae pv. actinidiae ICMP 19098]EPN07104.1 type IV pilus assembly protein PilX [Pseudomonas syringae pv. actinidiae ICMP 18804]EPN35599.1 type IV pilus assembly protein PilX [Pseudomonas syringae pv. actinidiae ICMP 18883]EPN50097.1 type IV pilus assembly pr